MFDLIDVEGAALLASALLVWVALVHFTLAAGVRLGELVWSGQQPRLLDPSLRLRSFIYAILLVISAFVLAFSVGVVESPIDERWIESATLLVTIFLAVACVYSIFNGTRWERFFFAPITLLGALVAGWLTFLA